MIMTGENRITRRKSCSSVSLLRHKSHVQLPETTVAPLRSKVELTAGVVARS